MGTRAARMDLVGACARLRQPYHTVHRWVLTGRLKGERRDGRWFVDRDDVERLVRERSNSAAAE